MTVRTYFIICLLILSARPLATCTSCDPTREEADTKLVGVSLLQNRLAVETVQAQDSRAPRAIGVPPEKVHQAPAFQQIQDPSEDGSERKKERKNEKKEEVQAAAPPRRSIENVYLGSQGPNATVNQNVYVDIVHNHASLLSGLLSLILGVPLIALACISRHSGTYDSASTCGGRSANLDFAKFWLMVVVVLVHSPWRTKPDCKVAIGPECNGYWFKSFNPWCTRTFALICGLCAQKELSFKSTLWRLVVPLILYCVLLGLIDPTTQWDGDYLSKIVYLDGALIPLWFLFALIMWKFLGAMLAPLPVSLRLVAATAFTAMAGYADLPAFKLYFAIPTFPLFLVGQVLPWSDITQRWPWSTPRCVAGISILCAVVFLQTTTIGGEFNQAIPNFSLTPVLQTNSFADEPFVWLRGIFRNVLELVKGLIFILSCPDLPNVFSELGQHTMYAFFLHLPMLHWTEIMVQMVPGASEWMTRLWILHAIFVVAVLSSRPVRIVFGPFLEPYWYFNYFMKASNLDSK